MITPAGMITIQETRIHRGTLDPRQPDGALARPERIEGQGDPSVVSQTAAHDGSIVVIPGPIAHSPPDALVKDLHPSLGGHGAPDQTNYKGKMLSEDDDWFID